ncbi:hypothetical protein IAR55_005590 [Kwoniella newhampshirensis]|uniref:Indole-diterpene biosynthesis protein PaxU n=1 Tax=Kwoniella newhampshirensis TaxID=1651941 RepID=A0AAW0YGU4_9TREE
MSTSSFKRLSSLVQIRIPTSTINANLPLVILCTWMDAPDRLAAKYANRYAELFPSSTIVHVRSTALHMFWTSWTDYDILMQPAVDAILSLAASDRERVVAAAYSNGGVSSINRLAHLYREHAHAPLPLRSLVIDSAPGSGDVPSAHRAISLSLPPITRQFPLSAVLGPALWLGLYSWALYLNATHTIDPIARLRSQLNDPDLFATGRKRRYIYSRADRMVPWSAVEESMRDAAARGWNTSSERFENSKHVAHAVADESRYWRAVESAFSV